MDPLNPHDDVTAPSTSSPAADGCRELTGFAAPSVLMSYVQWLLDQLTHVYHEVMVDTVLELVGAHEIRINLGNVSRQRVYQITGRADFPKPVADLAQGKVWLARDVDAWIKTNRRPGL